MTLEDFETVLAPKVDGTLNLSQTFGGQSLDFFVILSSAISILGSRGSGNYAAANAFQDAFARSQRSSATHYVSINLGAMKESGVLARNANLERMLNAQGVVPLKNAELFALLEYSISDQARREQRSQIVVGFTRDSLELASNTQVLKNPVLALLPSGNTRRLEGEKTLSKEADIIAAIKNSESAQHVREIFKQSIAQKISTLVIVDTDKIDMETSISELGLDSLVRIELKNWIAQRFQAPLQTSDIPDSISITSLASIAYEKSQIVVNSVADADRHKANDSEEQDYVQLKVKPTTNSAGDSSKLKQPLPDLCLTLDRFLELASAIASGEDFSTTQVDVEKFRKTGGHGESLQRRLALKSNDPTVENWLSDIVLDHQYLKRRSQLSNFFGSHSNKDEQHDMSSAERAAAISLAAFRCKDLVEKGEIGDKYLNGKVLSKETYQWLFNACREPCHGMDHMRHYPGNDYLVAFRRGRAYKIGLRVKYGIAPFKALKRVFEAILTQPQRQLPWMGILTADNRDEWAKVG